MQDSNHFPPEPTEPEQPPQPDFDLDLASVISGIIWVVLGALLIYFFHKQSVTEIFSTGQDIWLQLLWGISYRTGYLAATSLGHFFRMHFWPGRVCDV